MVKDNSEFTEYFGIDYKEVLAAVEAVLVSMNTDQDRAARLILAKASPETVSNIKNTLAGQWQSTLSKTGCAMIVSLSTQSPKALSSLDEILKNLLAYPVAFKHLPLWCLFFAARDAANKLQLKHCRSPTSESHLTGMLLEALSASCEVWSKQISRALHRSKASLTLRRIDLSILGGEQVTGGDFGLILELEGGIVPLVIQAKRYVRPNADVSQSHPIRGPQAYLLHETKCASAYIFYENGKNKIKMPLPPLLKTSDKIKQPTNTNVLIDSTDLSTFLLTAVSDPHFAPPARSPEEALRMIYSQADPGQLAYLAVISGHSDISPNYEAILQQLASEILDDIDEDHIEEENEPGP